MSKTPKDLIKGITDKTLKKKVIDGVRYRKRVKMSHDEIIEWISSTIENFNSQPEQVVKTHQVAKFYWTDYVTSLSIVLLIGMIMYYLVPLTKKVFSNDPIVAISAELIPVGLIVFVRSAPTRILLSLGFGVCSIGVLLVLQASELNSLKKDILAHDHEYQGLVAANLGLAMAVRDLPVTWVTKRNEAMGMMTSNQDKMKEIEKEAEKSAEVSTGKVLSWLMLIFRFFFFASALAFTHELGAKFQKWREARYAAL